MVCLVEKEETNFLNNSKPGYTVVSVVHMNWLVITLYWESPRVFVNNSVMCPSNRHRLFCSSRPCL